jgi:uncharacterized protein (TIGR02246 family)
MDIDAELLTTDTRFFDALLAADAASLYVLLTDDFLIVDVMSGAVHSKADFVRAIVAGVVSFTSIEPAEQQVRLWGDAAVVTGRTRMAGTFDGVPFTASSRYTHVYVRQDGVWRLASAQGTPLAE